MPVIDNNLVLSDAQAVTNTAVESTNVINKLAESRNINNPMTFEARVDTTFDTAEEDGTLTIAIQGSTDEAFTSPVTLASTGAIAEANLIANSVFRLVVPAGTEYQYIRGYYTPGAHAFTAGKIDLYPVMTPFQR